MNKRAGAWALVSWISFCGSSLVAIADDQPKEAPDVSVCGIDFQVAGRDDEAEKFVQYFLATDQAKLANCEDPAKSQARPSPNEKQFVKIRGLSKDLKWKTVRCFKPAAENTLVAAAGTAYAAAGARAMVTLNICCDSTCEKRNCPDYPRCIKKDAPATTCPANKRCSAVPC